MGTLWLVNPRRRRRKAKAGKRRSRRKMTAKQLKYFGGKKRSRRTGSKRRRRHAVIAAAASPVVRRRRRRSGGSVSVRRSRRSARRSGRGGFNRSQAVSMLKAGVIGGAGAVAGDIMMGYAARMLAGSMPALASPVNAQGEVNYGYFGTKAALLLALGMYGPRLPVVGRYAPQMAEGGLTVLAYTFLRPMAAKIMSLGYMNPAPTMRPGVGRYVSGSRGTNKYLASTDSRYVAGMGVYASIPVRSGTARGSGANAATVVSMVGRK